MLYARPEEASHIMGNTSTRIAFVGLGAMGEPMAAHLVRKGMRVAVVGHRRPEPVERLVAIGAVRASGVKEAVGDAEVVLLMLPGAREVEMLIDGEDGVLQHARSGALVIDCSTSDPAVSRGLAERLGARG